jgi:hypothetical protein
MPVAKSTARKLTTKAEWALLESSYSDALKALTPSQLKQRVVRARKLQDKYRDLARQQRGEARGKRPARRTRAAQGNANTREKQELFTEARLRFEAQLARLEAAAAREAEREARQEARDAAKAARKRPSSAARKRRSSRSAGKASAAKSSTAASRGARKASVFSRQATKAKRAHAGARGRRRQGKRDSR